jgi:hypothetical protein
MKDILLTAIYIIVMLFCIWGVVAVITGIIDQITGRHLK